MAAAALSPGGDGPWPRGEHLVQGMKAQGGIKLDFPLSCAALRFQNILCSLLAGFMNFHSFLQTVLREKSNHWWVGRLRWDAGIQDRIPALG